MSSNDVEVGAATAGGEHPVLAALATIAAGLDTALALPTDDLTTAQRLQVLQRCEQLRRRLPALEHPVLDELRRAEVADIGGRPDRTLADTLHITRASAQRRLHDAADLAARHTFLGQPQPPLLPHTAGAQAAGRIGEDHVKTIRDFFNHLPSFIDPELRAATEAVLADHAGRLRPDEFAKLAAGIFNCLVTDGLFSDDADQDANRDAKRGITIGPQQPDGMSRISGTITPALRAALDAALAKLAAPGANNPADDHPCTTGAPGQDAIDNDHRTPAQRNHDGLAALIATAMADDRLGHHNGLPVSLIISIDHTELARKAGRARTAGGTWLPIADLIKAAGRTDAWLRIYTGAKEVALYHRRRLANAGQRMVLHARDRGCTHPHCSTPGYHCEAHHITDYASTGHTDIEDLTFRCGPDHRLITPDGYTTRRAENGDIETIPPPRLDHGQARTNNYHHPERLLPHLNRNTGHTGGGEQDRGP